MNNQKVVVYKITLAGLLIALSVIFQRFFVIPFGVASLYRFSLGNLPIMMASLFLGPVFGLIVGASSDLLGATFWPVGTLLLWPVLSAAAYGLLPWLFLKAIKFIKKIIKIPFFYIFLALLFITIELYIFLNTSVRNPFDKTAPPIVFTTTFRIVFTLVFALLLTGVSLIMVYLEKRFKGNVSTTFTGPPSELAFAILLSLIIIDILYSSTWKLLLYQTDFFVSVFFHTLIGLILLPIQTSLLIITGRIFDRQSIAKLINKRDLPLFTVKEEEEDEKE